MVQAHCSSAETILREIKLSDAFINQLRRKDSALLAAYALATCLKHYKRNHSSTRVSLRTIPGDIKEFITDNEFLPKNIVNVLRLDCFDDAVSQVEEFQIFEDFMQHSNGSPVIFDAQGCTLIHVNQSTCEKNIKNKTTEVLDAKLAKCNPRESRTSLIFLDIVRSFDVLRDDNVVHLADMLSRPR